jgi:hypothetical protein
VANSVRHPLREKDGKNTGKTPWYIVSSAFTFSKLKVSIMKKNFAFFAIFITTVFAKTSLAQDDPCGCNIALEKNTQDEFQSINSSSFKQTLDIIFSHSFTFWENGEWKKDQAIASGGSYGVYSGFFDASQSTDEKQTKFQEMKSYYNVHNDISQADYKSYSQKIASGKAYDNWLECKRLCIDGDVMLLNKTVSGNEIIVTLLWKHKNTTDKQKILSIVTSNVTQLEGGNLAKDRTITGQNSYTGRFKRNIPTQDASIKVNVSEYSTNPIVVPGIEIENPASNYPVGTIIASVLEWKRFCKINNQSEILDYTDKAKCKWAPADGRLVIGSAYGTIENKVPDLRGVFLRAVNDFGVPGTTNIKPDQAETDDKGNLVNRPPNDFEPDEFRRHSHEVKGNGGGDPAGGWSLENVGRVDYASTTPKGGAETRPKNITVYYYIKIN